MTLTTSQHLDLAQRFAAHNYHPLPVVIAHAQGAWVTDAEGRRYLDCLAGYSALNFGHLHPELITAARDQLERLTLTSRAFHNDRLGPFCAALAELTGMDAVLPMNTGAEAVETAIKTARRWGNRVKGVPDGRQRIVVAENNFHGRTTTIVGFSSDAEARDGFAPFTPGFDVVPYGDAAAVRAAIESDTVAVLLEPIQGEAGVIVPPAGYLRDVRAVCDEQGVLLIADEIQSGLGRTGTTFACEGEEGGPRHLRARQGARRRDPAGLGHRGKPRGPRRDHSRQPRVDLRRQPLGLCGRARRGPAPRDWRVPGSRTDARRAPPRWSRVADRSRHRRRPGAWAVGGCRRGPGFSDRSRGLRNGSSSSVCSSRTPTAPRCASARHW